MLVVPNMDLLSTLKTRLQEGALPGRQAHKQMAVPARRFDPEPAVSPKMAAVLVPLIFRHDRWHVVLIRRNAVIGDRHSGQIGFPGGKFEPTDGTLLDTALREAKEEIGLPPESVEILGPLTPLYIPVSNFMVHPYLASAKPPDHYQLQPSEVSEVFEVPLQHFFLPENRKWVNIPVGSGIVLKDVPCFDLSGQVLWGATAMMLSELLLLIPTDSRCYNL